MDIYKILVCKTDTQTFITLTPTGLSPSLQTLLVPGRGSQTLQNVSQVEENLSQKTSSPVPGRQADLARASGVH